MKNRGSQKLIMPLIRITNAAKLASQSCQNGMKLLSCQVIAANPLVPRGLLEVPKDGREPHPFAASDNAAPPCKFAEVVGDLAILLGRI